MSNFRFNLIILAICVVGCVIGDPDEDSNNFNITSTTIQTLNCELITGCLTTDCCNPENPEIPGDSGPCQWPRNQRDCPTCVTSCFCPVPERERPLCVTVTGCIPVGGDANPGPNCCDPRVPPGNDNSRECYWPTVSAGQCNFPTIPNCLCAVPRQ